MNIKKFKFRFHQFGGWQLIFAFFKLGIAGVALKQLLKVVFGRMGLNDAYDEIQERIDPKLVEQYSNMILPLKNKYDGLKLEHGHNDIVWFCWLQGMEEAPELIKMCYRSQQKYLKGKEIKLITYDTYQDYITLPDYVVEKHKKGYLPHALFSDLIRLELLIKYGGTWIDSTVLCTSSDYPEKVLKCDLFLFQARKDKKIVGMSNWFITSCTNNEALMILRDILYAYWKDYNCVLEYYIFHLFLGRILKYYPELLADMPPGNNAFPLTLRNYMEETYNKDFINNLFSRCCFHKLNYGVSEKAMKKKDSIYNWLINEQK